MMKIRFFIIVIFRLYIIPKNHNESYMKGEIFMIIFTLDQNGEMIQEERFTDYINNHNLKLLEEFCSIKKLEGCSINTIKGYRECIKRLSEGTGKAFDELNVNDIRAYLTNYQLMHGIKNHSMDNIRRVFSSFFNFMDEEDYILKNPMRKIHKIKSEKTVQSPFTDKEMIILQDNCMTIRELALVDFLSSTGVRVSELCQLDKSDINMKEREGIVFGKGAKERIIYFNARAEVHLERYLSLRRDDNPALFVTSNYPYNRLTKTGVEYIITRLGMRSGIEKCHPHRFRRTLATNLIDHGVPIEQVQRILGHTKIETTLIYSQVNQENVKFNHRRFA